jgi:hypothetical protein
MFILELINFENNVFLNLSIYSLALSNNLLYQNSSFNDCFYSLVLIEN